MSSLARGTFHSRALTGAATAAKFVKRINRTRAGSSTPRLFSWFDLRSRKRGGCIPQLETDPCFTRSQGFISVIGVSSRCRCLRVCPGRAHAAFVFCVMTVAPVVAQQPRRPWLFAAILVVRRFPPFCWLSAGPSSGSGAAGAARGSPAPLHPPRVSVSPTAPSSRRKVSCELPRERTPHLVRDKPFQDLLCLQDPVGGSPPLRTCFVQADRALQELGDHPSEGFVPVRWVGLPPPRCR